MPKNVQEIIKRCCEAPLRLSKKSVGRVKINYYKENCSNQRANIYIKLYHPIQLISIQKWRKHRVSATFSHFSAKRVTTVLSTPTDPFHENLPSSYNIVSSYYCIFVSIMLHCKRCLWIGTTFLPHDGYKKAPTTDLCSIVN